MITSLPFRPAVLTALAALAMTWSSLAPVAAQAPSPYARTSVSGSYLAARHAGSERDAASAAAYYRAALRGDPRNNELLTRAFLAVLANVCYCAVYIVDLFVQFSGLHGAWTKGRIAILTVGTAFAAVIAHFFAMNIFNN